MHQLVNLCCRQEYLPQVETKLEKPSWKHTCKVDAHSSNFASSFNLVLQQCPDSGFIEIRL
jgi:hypothetical protein